MIVRATRVRFQKRQQVLEFKVKYFNYVIMKLEEISVKNELFAHVQPSPCSKLLQARSEIPNSVVIGVMGSKKFGSKSLKNKCLHNL